MGKKWATVSVSGYKALSVPDDGTKVEGNRVKYTTITTDLTDPIKTAYDSAIANLDELFTEATTATSTSLTTVATDHATWIEVTGTKTITLLAAATATAGYRVGIKNVSTGTVTVDGNGAETIDGATTISVGPNESVQLIVNAAVDGWIQIGGASSPKSFKAVLGGTQASVVKSTWTKVALNGDSGAPDYAYEHNIDFDSATNNRLDIVGIEKWAIQGGLTLDADAGSDLSDGTVVGIRIARYDSGDTLQNTETFFVAIGAAMTPTINVASVQACKAGDYIQLEGYSDDSAATTIRFVSDTTGPGEQTFMAGQRLL